MRVALSSSPVPKILETLDPDTLFYSLIADRAPLPGRKWGEGAVTLVGDAAHAVLPVMGQGACMAIEDGFELSNALQGFNKRRGKKNNGSIAKVCGAAIPYMLLWFGGYGGVRTTHRKTRATS